MDVDPYPEHMSWCTGVHTYDGCAIVATWRSPLVPDEEVRVELDAIPGDIILVRVEGTAYMPEEIDTIIDELRKIRGVMAASLSEAGID